MTRYRAKTIISTTLVGNLKDRLDLLDAEAVEVEKRSSEIAEQRDLIRKLLELEMRTTGRTDPKRRLDLGDIVKEALLDGKATKSGMNMEAMESGHSAPARGINAILMGFVNHGYAEKVSDDHYIITPKGKAAFAEKAAP